MIRKWFLAAAWGSFVALALMVPGCGDSGIKVTGSVTKGGAPYAVSEKGVFQLSFDDEKNAAESFPASIKNDGTFTIVGRTGTGIPPGKYIANVTAMDPYDKKIDVLKGKFSRGQSKLVVEVKDATPLKIEIGGN